jgi:60 kDa SS-A/Ro ribonucleoprotein
VANSRAAETWEARLTQAGDAVNAKARAWAELVRSRRLGYLALLRNVRNILTHAPEVAGELADQLADGPAVRRALVFPFQFLSAVDALQEGNLPGVGA